MRSRRAWRTRPDLLVTTGGTGLTPTDRTPEATAPFLPARCRGSRRRSGRAGSRTRHPHRGAVARARRPRRPHPRGQPAGVHRGSARRARGAGRGVAARAEPGPRGRPLMWERVRRRAAGSVDRGGAGAPPEGVWPWPVQLTGVTPTGVEVLLRPLTVADGPAFQSVRRANAAWLEEWDATSPDPDAPGRTFEELVEQYDRDARAGRALPFAVEVEGRFVGQLSVGSVVLGSFRSCYVGYWVSRSVAGQMVIPTALAVAGDYVLGTAGPAPHRGQHPAREHREPGRGAQAGLPPRGAAPALPAHRRGLARPPVVRADHRGPRRRDAAGPPACGSRRGSRGTDSEALQTQSSQQSLARHTERGPAPDGDAHLPS